MATDTAFNVHSCPWIIFGEFFVRVICGSLIYAIWRFIAMRQIGKSEKSAFFYLARKYFIFPLINIHFVTVLLSKENSSG